MGEEEDEELYADLYEHLGDGRQVPKTSLLEMEERLDRLAKQEMEMRTQNEALQKQNESLQRDKDILIRNISCLFKTAQMEVARKNKEINELRQEISQLKLQALHAESLILTEAQTNTKPEKLLQGVEAIPSVLGQHEQLSSQNFDLLRKDADLQTRGSTKGENDRGNHPSGVDNTCNKFEDYHSGETTVHENGITKVQHSDRSENIHADEFQGIVRFRSDKSDAQKNRPGDGDGTKKSRDARGLRIFESEARASVGACFLQNNHSFRAPCTNGKEQCSFKYDRSRECLSLEKIAQQKIDHGKDQLFLQQHKKARVNPDAVKDFKSINGAVKSIGDSDIVSGHDIHIVQTKSGGGKRKASDTVDIQKTDSSSEDLHSRSIQKRNCTGHGKTDKKTYGCVEINERGTDKLLDEEHENVSREDKIPDAHVANGFKSGKYHESGPRMDTLRVLNYFSETHSHENREHKPLSLIREEMHKNVCRDVHTDESWVRDKFEDYGSPAMKDADTGSAGSNVTRIDSHEVGEIIVARDGIQNMQDLIQNKERYTGSDGALEPNHPGEDYSISKGLCANQMKSYCSLAVGNKKESETCLGVDGDCADARLGLQGGIDEILADISVPRDLNVEGQKQSGTTDPGPAEMDDRRKKHCRQSICEKDRTWPSHGGSKEKQKDVESFVGPRSRREYEKTGKGSDLSSGGKRGADEKRERHTNRHSVSRKADGSIANDHKRGDRREKEGRTGRRDKEPDFLRANEESSERRREPDSINEESTNIHFANADGGRDEVMTEKHHRYCSSRKGGRDFIQEQGFYENISRTVYNSFDAEREEKRKYRYENRRDDRHASRKSEIHFSRDRRHREKNHRVEDYSADVGKKMDSREYVHEDGEILPSNRYTTFDRITACEKK